ncbi:MAG TPA: hypothetical protein VFA50_05865 [Stellaceae bacterium]|nr:hypothetical protein [Stellaceae bacterium]
MRLDLGGARKILMGTTGRSASADPRRLPGAGAEGGDHQSMGTAMAKSDPPPVPPAGRSDKGPGGAREEDQPSDLERAGNRPQKKNLSEQGQTGNVAQNTRNKGFQQDR